EVARHCGVGALEDAGPEAEVASLERDLPRSLRLLPQRLALELEQLRRAALAHHLPVALDFLLDVLRRRRRAECKADEDPREGAAHAPAVSILFDSPLLSSHATSIWSPLAPPLSRNENTGLRDTAWLTSASITAFPFSFTLTFWMKCSGWPLCAVVMGWVIRTRTSVLPPARVALIFIGPAMSASAPADSYLALPGGAVLPAARRRDHPHVGRLGHLHVHLHIGQRAFLEVELRGKRKGILLEHDRDRGGAGDIAHDLDRHHGAVLRDLRR